MQVNTNLRDYRKTGLLIGSLIILILSAFTMGSMVAQPEEYGFLPIALILGLFGTFFFLKRPLLVLALIFFFMPLGNVTRIIGGERAITFALAGLTLGIYGARVLVLHEKIKVDRLSQFACAFVVWGIITSLWAFNPQASLSGTFRLLQLIAICIIALNYCREQRHLDMLTLSFAIGAIVAATMAIFMNPNFASGGRLSLSEDFNPNVFSALLGVGIIFVFYHFYKTKSKLLKVFLVMSVFPIGYSIILAQSRGTWIAVFLSLFLSIILTTKNMKLIRNAVIVVTVFIGIVISAYYSGIVDERITERFDTLISGDYTTATAGRNEVWKVGLVMIEDTFPLGVGFRNFKSAFTSYAQEANLITIFTDSDREAHNTFIAVLAETGLVGFALFMGIFIYLFKSIWRITDPTVRLIQMWSLSFLLLKSLAGTYYTTPWFWFVLFIVASSSRLEKQTNPKVSLR